MSEPYWLTLDEVIFAHDKQLRVHGGPSGICDQRALESALSRPINQFHHGEADLAKLAAAYAFGLARNHAFVDGDKRISFICMVVFLRRNDVLFVPDAAQSTAIILALAAGEVSEDGLARWIRDNWPQ